MTTPPSDSRPQRPARGGPRRDLLVAAALAVVGVICLAVSVTLSARATSSFGWFAYTPLSNTYFVPSPTSFPALAVGAVGVLLVGAAVGIVVGRRLR